MTIPRKLHSSRRGATKALIALMALVATLFVSASPAAAETDCVVGENGDLIVRVNEETAGQQTMLHMTNGVLFVNGVSCGRPSPAPGNQAVVTIVDVVEAGEDRVEDTIVFDLSRGDWRQGGQAMYVNLSLNGVENGTDKVIIRGTSGPDSVLTKGDFILVNRPDLFTAAGADHRYFFMHTQGSIDGTSPNLTYNAEYEFRLGGGKDAFNMVPDDQTGGWFGQKVVVKGGSGKDNLNGGPGRQWLYGGPGADKIDGAGGNDRIKGQGGNDTLNGRKGNDYLHGGSGKDKIRGHAGNDTIIGGKGKDRTWGGSGNDKFKMKDGRKDFTVKGGGGNDTCVCDKVDPLSSTSRR